MTLCIIDGPDCTSKSSLAKLIADELYAQDPGSKITVIHRGPPTDHPLREYVEPLLDYEPGERQHVVCDRWHLGELVYPRLLDRPSQLTPGVNAWIELFLLSRGAYVVGMLAERDYLVDCGVARGDDPDELARIDGARFGFRRVFDQTLLPLTTLHAGDVSKADARSIITEARHLESRVQRVTERVTTYVGAPRPSLLLFGDRRGVAGDPADYGRWPAFAPFGGTSGSYLMTALTREPIRVPTHGHVLSSLALANSNDVDDAYRVWQDAGQPEVVALGVNAAETLAKVDVPARQVPHPQYWRRFRHHQPDAYVRRIFGLDEVAS